MATEAAQLECKESTQRKKERENRKPQILLTHTGLLMEGKKRSPPRNWIYKTAAYC
jgi:hypothetical protein